MKWETVIGLEVHVQLNTKTKLFCGCLTSFGDPANTHVCPVCMGHPGVLPVLNKEVLHKAILAGLALNCKINEVSKFDRKNYFYPDLPKAYQISQFDQPICGPGFLDLEAEDADGKLYTKRAGITRIHIEEDAGKLMHAEGGSVKESYVDLNRACTPLIEIVGDPDLRTSAEASAYLQKLRSIMLSIGVSDCNMEEGSLRCDANVSIRPAGETKFGNRTEIKNMNTFKGLQAAIDYEVRRQQRVLEGGGRIVTETLLFDPVEKKTRSMRSKEEAHDYRYFPEPDLPPVIVTQDQISEIRRSLPELPDAKKARFISEYKLGEYDASVLTADLSLAKYFEEAVAAFPEDPKKTCNFIITEVLGRLNDSAVAISDFKVLPAQLAGLMKSISTGVINGKIAKDIFPDMIESGKSAEEIIEEKGLKQVTDDGAIEAVIKKVLADNTDNVEKYKAGQVKLFGFFVGQIMKESKGKANPAKVNQILTDLLK